MDKETMRLAMLGSPNLGKTGAAVLRQLA